MTDMKEHLIRLGHETPELKAHIAPILDALYPLSKKASVPSLVYHLHQYANEISDWILSSVPHQILAGAPKMIFESNMPDPSYAAAYSGFQLNLKNTLQVDVSVTVDARAYETEITLKVRSVERNNRFMLKTDQVKIPNMTVPIGEESKLVPLLNTTLSKLASV
jgi:hypothetical protein